MQQAETSKCRFSKRNQSRLRGLGPGFRRGLGPRRVGLRTLGPKANQTEPPGGRQAKGWETAETAAAEVGAWREAGTGYPPTPPPPAFLSCKRKKEGFHPLRY